MAERPRCLRCTNGASLDRCEHGGSYTQSANGAACAVGRGSNERAAKAAEGNKGPSSFARGRQPLYHAATMHRSDAAAAVRHALGDELGRAKVPELRLVAHGPLLRRRAVEARPVILHASASTST